VSDEPITADLVELARRMLDAVNRRDAEAVGSLYSPDVVLDRSRLGLEVVQGRDAALQALTSLWALFEDLTLEEEEITDFGNGVGLAVYSYRGRPRESAGATQWRFAIVATSSDELLARVISYTDIDEARAARERLAQERG
jgi:ketosteroid isomerase-like protein